jgi:TPR repeat protein
MSIAANRGHVVAQNKLAKLYINAIGTRPDPIEATKWYVLSRKAGLADLELEDFFLGIDEKTQQEGIARADAFMGRGS